MRRRVFIGANKTVKKLIIIATVPIVFETWLKGQAKYLSQFYDVEIITSFSPTIAAIESYENVPVRCVALNRKINLLLDIKVLIHLWHYFRQSKPSIVYTLTPKAGLLGMLASCLCRVPLRIHNIVGLPMMEARGIRKLILEITERITYLCATHLYANSFNLKAYIQKYLTHKAVNVIAQGSINGVDVNFFHNSLSPLERDSLKKALGFEEGDFVITFVGRIVKDKGIMELVHAFDTLSQSFEHLKLLLVGHFEELLDPIDAESKAIIEHNQKITHIGFKEDIRTYLAITDLFVLPSYREGLPNVLIEAGSYGIPLLATNINGCNEVILPEKNGLLVEPKDIDALCVSIKRFIVEKDFYHEVKKNVRQSILNRYAQDSFWLALRDEFSKLEKEVKV